LRIEFFQDILHRWTDIHTHTHITWKLQLSCFYLSIVGKQWTQVLDFVSRPQKNPIIQKYFN
jgi:hypothetical protein